MKTYRIKNLAQKLVGGSETIKPGIYESLPTSVIEYQKKLNNLIEIEIEDQVKEESNFALELKVEDSIVKPEIKRTYKRKVRRNINDNSN